MGSVAPVPPGVRTRLRLPLRTVWHRLYADFLLPSRLDSYRRLLERFLGAGYTVISVESIWELISSSQLNGNARYLVLRHDIDTDPATAQRMWEIERALGCHGSYFFRLSTVDIPLMKAIAASGSMASYHYEEIAAVAKRRRLRSRDEALAHLTEAQEEFLRNLARLRTQTSLPMTVVASHGDFVNRQLGLPNWELLVDRDFRRRAGVELETYDEAVMGHVTSRHSDTLHPRYWIPGSPELAIGRSEPVVYVLVHPRHWRAARSVNARDDLGRLSESIRYRTPTIRSPR